MNQPVQQTTIVMGTQKSMGMAILLTILFGPLGLLYASVTGGIIMLVISLLVAIFTLGFGLLITWPICVIWAAVAVNKENSTTTAVYQNGETNQSTTDEGV